MTLEVFFSAAQGHVHRWTGARQGAQESRLQGLHLANVVPHKRSRSISRSHAEPRALSAEASGSERTEPLQAKFITGRGGAGAPRDDIDSPAKCAAGANCGGSSATTSHWPGANEVEGAWSQCCGRAGTDSCC